MKKQKLIDQITLTITYFKKLFNIKNILMFVIVFFLIFTAFHSINLIINKVNDSDNISLLLSQWNVKVFFISVYLIFILNYSYSYLKKNNFYSVNNYKNSISNLFIILLLAFVSYSILISFISLQFKNINYFSSIYYFNVMRLLFVFLFFNFISVLTISLFNLRNKYSYFLIGFIFVLSLIIVMNILVKTIYMNSNDLKNYYLNILIIEFYIMLGVLILAIGKRVIFYRKRSYKS